MIKMTLSMPETAAQKLMEGLKNKDSELMRIMEEFKIKEINQAENTPLSEDGDGKIMDMAQIGCEESFLGEPIISDGAGNFSA